MDHASPKVHGKFRLNTANLMVVLKLSLSGSREANPWKPGRKLDSYNTESKLP